MGFLVAVPASFLRGGGVDIVALVVGGSVGVDRSQVAGDPGILVVCRFPPVCFWSVFNPFLCPPPFLTVSALTQKVKFLYITVYKRNSCT